jgi:hypothetical protein
LTRALEVINLLLEITDPLGQITDLLLQTTDLFRIIQDAEFTPAVAVAPEDQRLRAPAVEQHRVRRCADPHELPFLELGDHALAARWLRFRGGCTALGTARGLTRQHEYALPFHCNRLGLHLEY